LTPSGETLLAEAVKKQQYINFSRMHPSLVFLKDKDEISLAFAQVAMAVRYLYNNFPAGTVRRLLEALRENNEKKAFASSLHLSVEQFEKKYTDYIATLPLKETKGTFSDQATYQAPSEEECVGADLRGRIRTADRMRTLGRYAAAAIEYEKALTVEPENPVLLLKYARALAAQGRYNDAIAKLNYAVAKNPYYVTSFEELGALALQQQDLATAARALEEALAINPYNPTTHQNLVIIYTKQGNTAAAEREFTVLLLLSYQ
jgi:tetratricopeptide (TPR) repeat protein